MTYATKARFVLSFIRKTLAQYNLPDELKYLSIIESGLNARAVSRARAVGLWQFMSGTGRYFNLQTDWYVDDRMDPEKSTDAACRYLSQLYRIFGNWELALAAYNSGPGTVRKAVRRSGYKKSFWEVYPHLPRNPSLRSAIHCYYLRYELPSITICLKRLVNKCYRMIRWQ
ncbi:MAG: lytic transglycosylase domain-containing protein [Flammeovirgaceae bacterium]|nr:lytic transglycosylase domain-containing protein [Flammeovirgaceae bacterium]